MSDYELTCLRARMCGDQVPGVFVPSLLFPLPPSTIALAASLATYALYTYLLTRYP